MKASGTISGISAGNNNTLTSTTTLNSLDEEVSQLRLLVTNLFPLHLSLSLLWVFNATNISQLQCLQSFSLLFHGLESSKHLFLLNKKKLWLHRISAFFILATFCFKQAFLQFIILTNFFN